MKETITLFVSNQPNSFVSVTEDMPSIRYNCNQIGENLLPALADVMSQDNNNVFLAFPVGKYVGHLQAYLDGEGFNMYFYDFNNNDGQFQSFLKLIKDQPQNIKDDLTKTFEMVKARYAENQNDYELVLGVAPNVD